MYPTEHHSQLHLVIFLRSLSLSNNTSASNSNGSLITLRSFLCM